MCVLANVSKCQYLITNCADYSVLVQKKLKISPSLAPQQQFSCVLFFLTESWSSYGKMLLPFQLFDYVANLESWSELQPQVFHHHVRCQ